MQKIQNRKILDVYQFKKKKTLENFKFYLQTRSLGLVIPSFLINMSVYKEMFKKMILDNYRDLKMKMELDIHYN